MTSQLTAFCIEALEISSGRAQWFSVSKLAKKNFMP
jgi:hypothetical protein